MVMKRQVLLLLVKVTDGVIIYVHLHKLGKIAGIVHVLLMWIVQLESVCHKD